MIGLLVIRIYFDDKIAAAGLIAKSLAGLLKNIVPLMLFIEPAKVHSMREEHQARLIFHMFRLYQQPYPQGPDVKRSARLIYECYQGRNGTSRSTAISSE